MIRKHQERRAVLNRLAAVFGLAVALGAALFAGIPASANAEPAGPSAPVATARDTPRSAQQTAKVYYLPGKVRTPLAKALNAAQSDAVSTRASVTIAPAAQSDCSGAMVVCLWTDDYYTGWFAGISGNFAWCEGIRFENTVFQDHVYSIWNRGSGAISIWDRFHDGSFRYTKYGWLQGGYTHDTRFTYIMDAWANDPLNNCTSLNLHQL